MEIDLTGNRLKKMDRRPTRTTFVESMRTIPTTTESEVLDACRDDNIAVDRYLGSGQLVVTEPEEMFFAGGPFDVDVILQGLRSAWTQAKADGWERRRCQRSVALFDRADERDRLALEFRVDFECLTELCSMLCIYDARQPSGSFITQVIKAHPVIGLGKGLTRNPFYDRASREDQLVRLLAG